MQKHAMEMGYALEQQNSIHASVNLAIKEVTVNRKLRLTMVNFRICAYQKNFDI